MERNSAEITFLVEDIEAILEMNRILESENQELKQEVARLKSHISSLKAHDNERKSMLWKKIQFPRNADTVQARKQDPALGPISTKNPRLACTQFGAPVSPKVVQKGPPPPPPPLPSKSLIGSAMSGVQRVPGVSEFYRWLNKKNVQVEKRGNVAGSGAENNPRNMIGEIENRSTYLSAVKLDVEMQREFINFIIQEVQAATFKDIKAVEDFVKWLDRELSCLVDERAVLKHFPEWPERRTDSLREAAGFYRDLKSIESEILMHKDNPKQLLHKSLGRIQALQDRLERVMSNTERVRDGAMRRYKELQIPCDWMLDIGLIGQIKLLSLKLAREYIQRVVAEVQSPKSTNADDIIHQAARFAYRVHQFAGGFDKDTLCIFDDLKQLHTTYSQTSLYNSARTSTNGVFVEYVSVR
ncbi:hypothetical protein vseg_017732 [Gypsophila vaccaria]